MAGIQDTGTIWFRRFVKEAQAMSSHIRFKRIKYGFYRIYWVGGGESAYIGECYKEMPEHGYDIEDLNQDLDSKKYFEEFEDNAELIRKVKNFVEGYRESIKTLRTRIYMLKNDKEFRNKAVEGYKTRVVK
jgi:4-alpha-glucanotransferase